MEEFAYAVFDGIVLNNVQGGNVTLHRGDVWHADDPFVQSRRDLFSATPPIVHSTIGRPAPEPTPLGAAKPAGPFVAAEPVKQRRATRV